MVSTRRPPFVVVGQYDYPEGLFFGGKQPEEGVGLYTGFLTQRMGIAERVLAIDVPTGLGPFFPPNPAWRESVLSRGMAFFRQAAELVSRL